MVKPLTSRDALALNLTWVGGEQRPSDFGAPMAGSDAVFAVVGDSDTFLGLVLPNDVAKHPHRIFADLISNVRPSVSLATPLAEVAEQLKNHSSQAVAVLENGRCVGAVTSLSLQRALLQREGELLSQTRADAAHLAVWSAQLERLHAAALGMMQLLGASLLEKDALHAALEALAKFLDARYAAIGLLSPDGTLQRFVVAGLSEEEIAQIGEPPVGKGLLGVVVRKDEALRLEDMGVDPRRAGFPPHHPAMKSLLAVPISRGGEVMGRVYLCDKRSGEPFTEDDERLARCLAATISAMLHSARELEQRHKLEAQLRQAQKLEAIGRLASGIAHDFNNLLTVISCASDELRTEPGLSASASSCVDEVIQSSRRAAALTRQLLAFGRQQPLVIQAVDLNDMVHETTKMLQRLLGDDIVVVALLEAGLPQIEADPTQVCQLLMNLATNGRDAMSDGGTLTISTRRVIDARAVELEVRDEGSGIAAEDLPHVFEPFFTTKEFGKGTGLGLATVYGIVQQCGGTIDIKSEVGHGTTFTISFPEAAQPTVSAPSSATWSVERPIVGTILVVEDSLAVRSAISATLKRHGSRVLGAANGVAALGLYDLDPASIRLVVTDVDMPGMSGPELAEALRKKNAGLRVLFLSGATQPPLAEWAAFMPKPFAGNELIDKVRGLLGGLDDA